MSPHPADARDSRGRGRPTRIATCIMAVVATTASSLPAVAAEAVRQPPAWSAELVANMLAEARAQGDARRGAGVFNVATSACTSCHKVGEQGGEVGPPLTTVAKCLTPEEIVESLFWPSRTVKPDYRAVAITTADGRVLQGIVKEETAATVTLVDAAARIHSIPIADVEERRDVGSLMPADVVTALPVQQQRDLVRYLLELGRTPGLESLSHRVAPFTPPRQPLRPDDWPHAGHFVNRERVYDFYEREAAHFRGMEPMPLLLPAFPGIDGGTQGHWGNQNEETWKDDRRNASDPGSLQCWPFATKARRVPRAVCLRLGDHGELSACFNPDTLAVEAVWTGGFLTFSDQRRGFLAAADPAGTLLEPAAAPAAPPAGTIDYHGFYRHGPRVIFSYAIDGIEYLDTSWAENGRLVREVGPAAGHPLANLTRGGPPQWPQVLTTTGTLGDGSPYATDTIAAPFDNPWKSLLFFSGLDFFADGSAAVCTIQGEVWRASGLDDTLRDVRWRRIAAGLNQPLGLVVVDDVPHVLCGDQLTRLVDTNGDGEADFYQCLSKKFEPSTGHNYKCGLERDAAGNFFTASHQGLLRISPDGATVDVLAVGFRNPDGLGLLPDGTLTVPVSEGDLTPASAICSVRQRPGEPPADPVPNFRGTPPALPLAYLPRGLDNSSGGQIFVSSDRWGPLAGQLLHFSFGTCSHFLVLRDEVDGTPQAAVVPLVGDFRSGAHRGRFHPRDGQLYVCGMNGWSSYAVDDGCLQRVRYTGGVVQQPVRFRPHRNGVLLEFSAPLDPAVAGRAASHFAQCWNYRYGPAYGSPEFSPSHYGVVGHDPVAIASATVLPDGRSLFLEMPDIQPVSQLHMQVAVGGGATRDLFATVHALAEPFRGIPGFRETDRPIAAHPILRDVAMMKAAVKNPWLKPVAAARPIAIEAASNLAYATTEFHVAPGEPLAVSFVNPDVVPHNWVLVRPGTLESVGSLADRAIADPEAVARHYVPKTDDVLAYADIVQPGERQTIHFTAPTQPGRYPYLCTFPGHWKLMNGTMIVDGPSE